MVRTSRSITAITPLQIKAVMRDHCLVLEGRIDDENIHYVDSTGAHVPISPARVLDLPSSKNGVYSEKFIMDYNGVSFYSAIWQKILDHVNDNHIYRLAKGGPTDISGLNQVKGSKDGAEAKSTGKSCKLIIKKPENWKLLYIKPVLNNGIFTGVEYTARALRGLLPAACLSFEMSKRIYENNTTGIDTILESTEDGVEETILEYRMIYNNLDFEDEYVFFQVSAQVAYEVIL